MIPGLGQLWEVLVPGWVHVSTVSRSWVRETQKHDIDGAERTTTFRKQRVPKTIIRLIKSVKQERHCSTSENRTLSWLKLVSTKLRCMLCMEFYFCL